MHKNIFYMSISLIALSVVFVCYALSRNHIPAVNLSLLGAAWLFLTVAVVANLFQHRIAVSNEKTGHVLADITLIMFSLGLILLVWTTYIALIALQLKSIGRIG